MSRPSPARGRPAPWLYARALAFYAGLILATLVFAPLAILAMLLPYHVRYRIVVRWAHIMTWWLNLTCALRHTIEGLENIPETPTIVLAKHESAWETIVLQHYFSPQTWVLKRELMRLPFFGWGLATLKPIAIDRSAGKNALDQVVRQGRERLENRIWVVIFPEGTRVAPGAKRRYKLGGATLAEHTGYPVIPVAHDSGDYWPRNSFIKRPGTIRLVIGPPIDTTGLSGSEINARAEAWIESTMRRLRPSPVSGSAAA
jgi:1-acyl-sn-glycerol-3-phosphate acyltransferase